MSDDNSNPHQQRELDIAAAQQLFKFKTLDGIKKNVMPSSKLQAPLPAGTAASSAPAPSKQAVPDQMAPLNKAITDKKGRSKGKKAGGHPSLARPQRPLSSYNIFFKEERQKIIDEAMEAAAANPDSLLTDGNKGIVSFSGLAKTIAARWKTISEDDKKKYCEKASVEMGKYRETVKEYNEKLKELAKNDPSLSFTKQDKNNLDKRSQRDSTKNQDMQASLQRGIMENIKKQQQFLGGFDAAGMAAQSRLLPIRKRQFLDTSTALPLSNNNNNSMIPSFAENTNKRARNHQAMASGAAFSRTMFPNQSNEGSMVQNNTPSFMMNLPKKPTRDSYQQQIPASRLTDDHIESQIMMKEAAALAAGRPQPQDFRRQFAAAQQSAAAVNTRKPGLASFEPYAPAAGSTGPSAMPSMGLRQQQNAAAANNGAARNNIHSIVRERAIELEAAKRLVEEMQRDHDIALLEAASLVTQQEHEEHQHRQHLQQQTTSRHSRAALLLQLQQEEQREQQQLLLQQQQRRMYQSSMLPKRF